MTHKTSCRPTSRPGSSLRRAASTNDLSRPSSSLPNMGRATSRWMKILKFRVWVIFVVFLVILVHFWMDLDLPGCSQPRVLQPQCSWYLQRNMLQIRLLQPPPIVSSWLFLLQFSPIPGFRDLPRSRAHPPKQLTSSSQNPLNPSESILILHRTS